MKEEEEPIGIGVQPLLPPGKFQVGITFLSPPLMGLEMLCCFKPPRSPTTRMQAREEEGAVLYVGRGGVGAGSSAGKCQEWGRPVEGANEGAMRSLSSLLLKLRLF